MAKQKTIKQSKGPLASIKFNTVPDKTVRSDLGGTNVTEVSNIFVQNPAEPKVEDGSVHESISSGESESTVAVTVNNVPQDSAPVTEVASKKNEENNAPKPTSGSDRKSSGRSNKKEEEVAEKAEEKSASRLPADFYSRISDKTKSARFNLHMDFDLYFDILAIFECEGYRGRGVKEPMLCDVLKEWAENTIKTISKKDGFEIHRSEVINDYLHKIENKKKEKE